MAHPDSESLGAELPAGARAANVTAKQAASNVAVRLQDDHQLAHVVYRNGARVPVSVWAGAATLAEERGGLQRRHSNRTREVGVRYVEIFDGMDCE